MPNFYKIVPILKSPCHCSCSMMRDVLALARRQARGPPPPLAGRTGASEWRRHHAEGAPPAPPRPAPGSGPAGVPAGSPAAAASGRAAGQSGGGCLCTRRRSRSSPPPPRRPAAPAPAPFAAATRLWLSPRPTSHEQPAAAAAHFILFLFCGKR